MTSHQGYYQNQVCMSDWHISSSNQPKLQAIAEHDDNNDENNDSVSWNSSFLTRRLFITKSRTVDCLSALDSDTTQYQPFVNDEEDVTTIDDWGFHVTSTMTTKHGCYILQESRRIKSYEKVNIQRNDSEAT